MAEGIDTTAKGKGSSFSGKIAVLTNIPSQTQNDEEIWSAEQLMVKYGSDKVVHATWPNFFMQDREQVNAVIAPLAVDREVKVVIMNKSIQGCNAAIDKLRSIRDDIFVIYCVVTEPPSNTAMRAHLMLDADDISQGPLIVKQAKKQGAKAFVHYSFPRHLAVAPLGRRRDLIQEACAAEGLRFLNAIALDPTDDMYAAQQFILDDVSKQVAKYGEDTAFFCTNCFLQVPLIRAVVDCRAIYPQPCCPSPFHGFPEALGIEMPGLETPPHSFVINETRRIAASKNMTGRLSSWPISLSMMFTHVGAEYAIKWINGQVPKTGIDDKVLMDCIKSYIKEVSGDDLEISMTSYSEQGVTYDNFKLLLMDYLDY